MPLLLKQKYTSLQNEYFSNLVMIHRAYAEFFVGYRRHWNTVIGIGLFLVVFGVIGFAVGH